MQCSKNCSPHNAVVSLQSLIDPVADPLRMFARVYGLALRKCQAQRAACLYVILSSAVSNIFPPMGAGRHEAQRWR